MMEEGRGQGASMKLPRGLTSRQFFLLYIKVNDGQTKSLLNYVFLAAIV
jgi:hypothetical protein